MTLYAIIMILAVIAGIILVFGVMFALAAVAVALTAGVIYLLVIGVVVLSRR